MKKQMRFYYWWSLVISMSLLLSGCFSKFQNISQPDVFLTKKDVSVGIIWISDLPGNTAMHYMIGGGGLLDQAINRAFCDAMLKELGKIKLESLMNDRCLCIFRRALENKGFTVKINTVPYCWEKFKNCTNALKREGWVTIQLDDCWYGNVDDYDLKPVILDLDVDYLLAFLLIAHGTKRDYFGMIPTSPPKGVTALISFLIDGKTEEIISQYLSYVVEPVQGEWDEPPEYANVIKAANASLERAIDEVFIDIFKQAP